MLIPVPPLCLGVKVGGPMRVINGKGLAVVREGGKKQGVCGWDASNQVAIPVGRAWRNASADLPPTRAVTVL